MQRNVWKTARIAPTMISLPLHEIPCGTKMGVVARIRSATKALPYCGRYCGGRAFAYFGSMNTARLNTIWG
jgi:hypothetical protein